MFTLGNRRLMHLSTYGLALFFILLPFEYPLAAMGTQSILMLVGVATMGLAVIDLFALQRGNIKIDYKIILPVLWLIYAASSLAWTQYYEAYWVFYMMYLRNCLMFILIAMIDYNRFEALFLKKAAVLGVGLLMLYMTFIPGTTRYSSYQNRLELVAGSSNLDENYLAALLLIGFGFVLHWIVNQKKAYFKEKITALLYCGGCIYYIFATGSRSGLIACIVMIIILLAGSIRKNTMFVLVLGLILVIAYPYILMLLPADLADRYSIVALTGQTAESSPRMMIWSGLLSKLNGVQFITGFGAGSASPITREVYSYNAAAHSFYIAHLVELGIVGLSMFLMLMLNMLTRLLKYKKMDSVAVFLGIMVIGFFLDLLTTKFFWAVMMLTCVSISAVDREHIELK